MDNAKIIREQMDKIQISNSTIIKMRLEEIERKMDIVFYMIVLTLIGVLAMAVLIIIALP